MLGFRLLLAAAAWWTLVAGHTVITYPGWRGDNLHTNGTESDGVSIIPGSLGENWNETSQSYTFPYGMQWMYPCGGMPTSRNRTKWPVGGGAIAIQPGWFAGHSVAFFYINMGYGTEPQNMSHPMVSVFQIVGPSNSMYQGEFCLPQVPLPANFTPEIGDNATIQVVETAQHGAALYNCVDITFADPSEVEEVTEENCRNSTEPGKEISFNVVIATKLDSAAPALPLTGFSIHLSLAIAFYALWFWL